MWGVEFTSDEPFAYSVIGVQYQGETPRETTWSLIRKLDELLLGSSAAAGPAHTDHLVEDGHGHLQGWKSRIWLSYWATSKEYDAWKQSPPVAEFWNALPTDAGVYREVLRVSPRRTQLGTNKEKESGMGHIGSLKPLGEKSMYWGCYRDRYLDSSADNKLSSTLDAVPDPIRPRPSKGTATQIRPGRTTIKSFPENLCFVVEGQDHSEITVEEKKHWFEHFDGAVTKWMQDLMDAGPEEGILDAKVCYSNDSGLYRNDTVSALNYNKKVQLFWFLDHRHMEKIGRSNKGHVALRHSFIQSYCPAGPMGADGKLLLWVETSVLKADEIEAEYIGAVEGTGFMAYDHHPEFQSTQAA